LNGPDYPSEPLRGRPAGLAGAALALPKWSGSQSGSAGTVARASKRKRGGAAGYPVLVGLRALIAFAYMPT
jgi:hypothetical protein